MHWLVLVFLYYHNIAFFKTDIDECGAGTDSCDENAHCNNTEGSYRCSCSSGYSGNGTTCNGL